MLLISCTLSRGAIITKDQHLQFLREHPAGGQRPEKHFADLHVRIYGEAGIVNGAVIETTEQWQAVSAQELPVPGP